jgi:hypothetical protein
LHVYLYDFNSSANNTWMIKYMRLRWWRPMARMWEDRNTQDFGGEVWKE